MTSARKRSRFVDIDNDGDLDVFIGEKDGYINYYENTGDSSNPNFVSASNPFSGIDVGKASSPTFVDIDNDGDMDAFVGEEDGKMNFYENTGTANSPVFASNQQGAFGISDVGKDSTPTFVDIDNDGDMDLFVGEENGNINFFENTGDASNPSFTLNTSDNPFSGVDVGKQSDITFADLDNDGDYDAIIGEKDGYLNYYENTGSSSSPSFSSTTAPSGLSDIGKYSKPTFADIDGDGDLDVFVGVGNAGSGSGSGSYLSDGETTFFENTSTGIDFSSASSYTVTVEASHDGTTVSEDVTFHFGTDGSSASGDTTTIDSSNYTDTSSGFTVTAQNVSGGAHTSASVSNVSVFIGQFGRIGNGIRHR